MVFGTQGPSLLVRFWRDVDFIVTNMILGKGALAGPQGDIQEGVLVS